MARWSVARERDWTGSYYDEVQVSCAFVVGPHSQDTLESFALWCVREQIAVATGHIRSGDVAKAVGGGISATRASRRGRAPDLHPVTSFLEQVVLPGAALDWPTGWQKSCSRRSGTCGRRCSRRASQPGTRCITESR